MNENLPEVAQSKAVAHQSFFGMEPHEQVTYATKMATVLADIIEKQKLYSTIGGKNHVRVEGWQTLGTFIGITAREREVTRLADGSYVAFVDLIKFSDGTVVGGASSLCSVNEKRWGSADEFARRSMAITRATGKAFRSNFAWIITLAGYEPCPAEEMPDREEAPKKVVQKADKSRDIKEELSEKNAKAYNDLDPDDIERLQTYFESNSDKIKPEHHLIIAQKLNGKPWYKLPAIAKEVTHAAR